jgi:hypothetical protein
MIQQVLVVLLFVVLLVQIGVLHIDTLTSFFQKDGYESDDEIDMRKYKKSKRKDKKKRKDTQMTPISSIIQERQLPSPNPEDPEEIQRAIMNELNQHDALFLTPSPI